MHHHRFAWCATKNGGNVGGQAALLWTDASGQWGANKGLLLWQAFEAVAGIWGDRRTGRAGRGMWWSSWSRRGDGDTESSCLSFFGFTTRHASCATRRRAHWTTGAASSRGEGLGRGLLLDDPCAAASRARQDGWLHAGTAAPVRQAFSRLLFPDLTIWDPKSQNAVTRPSTILFIHGPSAKRVGRTWLALLPRWSVHAPREPSTRLLWNVPESGASGLSPRARHTLTQSFMRKTWTS